MKKYLIQTLHDVPDDAGPYATLATAQQVIDAIGFADCSGDTHAVFDVSVFGQVERLTEAPTPDMPGTFHKFVNSKGEVVFSGFHVEH